MRIKWFLIFLLLNTHSHAFAQERLDFTTIVDGIYGRQYSQVGYEILLDQLWEFYQHPIDLNTATKEDLKRLHLLSNKQLDNLFIHLHKNGPLVSCYELQAIPGFDATTVQYLLPFITIAETYPPNQGLPNLMERKPAQGSWLLRYGRILETRQGYKVNKASNKIPYQGSADKLATRLKWSGPNGWSFGLAGKTYPGEPFAWDPTTERYGFDVWTGYLMLADKGYLKKLILGHYQVGYGQGLVVHTGFNMDKSAETIPIMRTGNLGLKPHSSFTSYGFRGLGATLGWKFLEQTIYYAYNSLDGLPLTDKDTGETYLETVQRGGLHRTVYEIKKKSRVTEHIIGSTLVYKPKNQQTEVGINMIYNQYSWPIRPPSTELPYSFVGDDNSNISLFYRYLWRNLHFFGEAGLAQRGGRAGLVGIIASLAAFLDLSILLRHYDPDFHNFYGDAFRENASGNHNETGFYTGIDLRPLKKLKVSAYYDFFKFPQPTTRIAKPSTGDDWLLQATYQIHSTNLVLLQYRTSEKARNIPTYTPTSAEKNTAPAQTRKYKLRAKQQITKSIGTSSEIQVMTTNFREALTGGYGLAQRITYKINKIALTAQLAWFDTDLDNRLYFPEKAPLYSRPMPSLYYKQGIKTYFLVGYKPTDSWRLEGRYSLSWYINETKIGTGHETIKGSFKNEISLQLIYSL